MDTELLRKAQQRMDTKDIKSIYFSIFSSCEIKIINGHNHNQIHKSLLFDNKNIELIKQQ